MTPPRPKVIRIPGSGTLVKISTRSGNSFGAELWTDGKMEGPMLPDEPWLQRHPETGELFWWDECERVAEDPEDTYSAFSEEWPLAYQKLPFGEEPNVDHYRQALDTGITSTSEKERYVLTRYWWLVNDPIRHGEGKSARPADFRERLLRLRSLLKISKPDQRLMAAEISRELGDFPGAKTLLEKRFSRDYATLAALMKKLTVAKDSTLQAIPEERPTIFL